jgi:hypothetical protein
MTVRFFSTVLSASVFALSTVIGVSAQELPPPPPLKVFHTEVVLARNGAPNALIAVPPGEEYEQIGKRVSAAIARTSQVTLPVQDASQISLEMLRSTNMILVGYFASNPLVEYLYDEYFINLDMERPGRGGYEVRTVHDPLGAGTSFVYLGGADADAAGKAADDFIASLPQRGDVIYPHTVKVLRADGSLTYKSDPDSVARRVDAVRGKNFRDVATGVTGAAIDYYLTGNPDSLEVFRQTWPMLHEHVRGMKTVGDARGAFYLFNMWDNIEEAPQFSHEERAQVTAFLWEFASKFAYAGREPETLTVPPGNDWDSRVAWDIARYFHKYYGLDVGGLWAWANARFQGKAHFWRSNEDCPGYGGMTIYDTFYYAVPAHYNEWFDSGMARKACDYGIAIMNNLGGHAGFGDTSSMGAIGYWSNLFKVAAWKYRDGRYEYAANVSSGLSSSDFNYNQYQQDVVEAVVPEDMLGIHVIPLPEWVYESREKTLGTAPPQMNPVLDADPVPPQEQCFDKIVFRDSFDPQKQYLIVGGISHGYHAHPDGNSIIEFTDKGRYCLFDSGYFVPDTIEHNTLVVYRDGLFEPIPRLTGLSAMGDFPDVGITQTYLDGYNGVNWKRNIIWGKERYFLVIDEVEAEEAGSYGLNAVFRTVSDAKPEIGEDRVTATTRGRPFRLINASHTPFKTTGTTPPSAVRHAVIESKALDMQPGDRQYFANLLYCDSEPGPWAYDMVPVGENAVMISSADGYALAGTGKVEPTESSVIEAAAFHITPQGFAMIDGSTLTASATWFSADKPVNIHVALGETATGSIEAAQDTVVRLYAQGDQVNLDGKPIAVRTDTQALEFDVPAGSHSLSFTPGASAIEIGSWSDTWTRLQGRHHEALIAMAGDEGGDQMAGAAWKVETSRIDTMHVYVNDAGEQIPALHKTGTAKCWTEAQRGASPRNAVDGNPETYAAVSSSADWARDLPKDIGVEWSEPVSVGSLEIEYYNATYGPTDAGQELQAWDGEDWYPIQAQITRDETGANWTYAFEPVETTRLRVFITEFAQARTAVAELRIFPEAAHPEERQVRVPYSTNGLKAFDIDGDGKAELLAAVGPYVRCFAGDGALLWEVELEKDALCIDAYDLDNDGRAEIVVGGADHKLYCFDYQGNERWSVLTPADPYFPEVEPATGPVRVVGCADINGDGFGEIVLGSGNWFAYAYDRAGNKLWGELNWAHQPTSIAFTDLGDGTLGTLIGTTYNDANIFAADGKLIRRVSVGYHGAAMSVVAGDMDENGKPELIAGSRVGGVHCVELGSDATWAKFMGAEVTQVALADLNGDGRLELIAGSKNFHVMVTDAAGEILWARNVGEAILDLVVADLDGDGTPEIVVATEGGMVRVLDAAGDLTATMHADGDVTKVVVGDFSGDGGLQVAAGADDGFIYGDIR